MREEKIEDFYKTNCYYHIYNRGNWKEKIYRSEKDYKVFVNLMFEYIKPTRLKLIAYCLMPNHFHLIIKNGTKKKEISKFMQKFMTAYVMYFNRKK